MREYQTKCLDSTIEDCADINLRIRKSVHFLISYLDIQELREELQEIRDKYALFKSKLSHTVAEIKINLLEIEDELIFNKYDRYLEIKTSTLSGIIGPEELSDTLEDEGIISDFSGTFLQDFIIHEVPTVLDHFSISSFLYTYSFMLKIYCNSLIRLSLELSFKGLDKLNTTVFEKPLKPKSTRLKLNLSVPQIAYFFKVLSEEDFFDYKHKTEIYRFISENFSSTKKEEISFSKIKNTFESPDFATIDFLHGKLINVMQKSKKHKDNL